MDGGSICCEWIITNLQTAPEVAGMVDLGKLSGIALGGSLSCTERSVSCESPGTNTTLLCASPARGWPDKSPDHFARWVQEKKLVPHSTKTQVCVREVPHDRYLWPEHLCHRPETVTPSISATGAACCRDLGWLLLPHGILGNHTGVPPPVQHSVCGKSTFARCRS